MGIDVFLALSHANDSLLWKRESNRSLAISQIETGILPTLKSLAPFMRGINSNFNLRQQSEAIQGDATRSDLVRS